MGGNLIRLFWSLDGVFEGDHVVAAAAVNSTLNAELLNTSVFMRSLEERIEQLDRADRALDQLLAAANGDEGGPFRLQFAELDAVLDGIEEVNGEGADGIQVLLASVSSPPRFIVEAPSDGSLAAAGRSYTFATLWERYLRLNGAVYRRLVGRYAADRPGIGLCALEIGNEPDYNWVPEEVKIEFGGNEFVNPLGKYVTELYLSQVPVADRSIVPFEKSQWGFFQSQDGPWLGERPERRTSVLEFDWGNKFDWYVKCCAELTAHVAWAIKDEAATRGVQVATVSGSVTHNNIDYLLRMHRADRNVFRSIDKIGLHPYHWVGNEVWDSEFVSDQAVRGWPKADPRAFATNHLKRFDFLRAFAGRSGDRRLDRELRRAFGGRKLWITEFGIATKVLGSFNAAVADATKFIRPRAQVGSTGGYGDVIWEDLWSAFLDQVDGQWLQAQGVECLLLYALRELDLPGFDLDDEDRSNFALFRSDGTPRIDQSVIERIRGLTTDMSGRGAKVTASSQPAAPPELYRRPWQSTVLSEHAREVMTMLSIEERQLLHWLTARHYEGVGAIVDGGCFVGGSTVPLAEGLRAAGRHGTIDVYDVFDVEPYMAESYFKGLDLRAGDSFRPLFENNTAHVSDLLRIHAGDVTSEGWRGDPIEILFIDFAKDWSLNDFIVANFFPHLIPGRSVVVQQDFVFPLCPWVAVTMEELADCFEPVAFAEYSSVVYFVKRQPAADLPLISRLPQRRQLELFDRAIARFRGYPRDVLECGKATLLIDHADREQAGAILERLASANGAHTAVAAAIELVRSLG